jgi:hypothetical protein
MELVSGSSPQNIGMTNEMHTANENIWYCCFEVSGNQVLAELELLSYSIG